MAQFCCAQQWGSQLPINSYHRAKIALRMTSNKSDFTIVTKNYLSCDLTRIENFLNE